MVANVARPVLYWTSSTVKTILLSLRVIQMSPPVLLLLCCPPQAAVVLWFYPCDWLCMQLDEPHQDRATYHSGEAMNDPGTEMQPGPHTVSSVSRLRRWNRWMRGDEQKWDLEPALLTLSPLEPLLMLQGFLELRATGTDFTTRGIKGQAEGWGGACNTIGCTLLWLYF